MSCKISQPLLKALFLMATGLMLLVSSLLFESQAKDVHGADVKRELAKIEENFVVGKVLSVSASVIDGELFHKTGIKSARQDVTVEIVEGPLKGTIVTLPNELTDNPAYNIKVKPGQELILSVVTENGQKPEVNISDYRRSPILAWLLCAFFAVFFLFGGNKGIKSLFGLLLCVLLIAFILLPLSLSGINPLVTSVSICLIVTVTSMLFIAGFSRKAASAIIGTVGGVIIAGIASQIVILTAPLTGLSSEEAQILRGSLMQQPPEFFSGLLAAGMLIGALGVIMDVGISVASAVFEVSQADKTLSAQKLYRSGMNVGRDIMGTMTNTLVLAYAGGALPLLLLVAQMPSVKLLNLDLVATEVAAALTGSIGLICTIPLTALAASKLMGSSKNFALDASVGQAGLNSETLDNVEKIRNA